MGRPLPVLGGGQQQQARDGSRPEHTGEPPGDGHYQDEQCSAEQRRHHGGKLRVAEDEERDVERYLKGGRQHIDPLVDPAEGGLGGGERRPLVGGNGGGGGAPEQGGGAPPTAAPRPARPPRA